MKNTHASQLERKSVGQSMRILAITGILLAAGGATYLLLANH